MPGCIDFHHRDFGVVLRGGGCYRPHAGHRRIRYSMPNKWLANKLYGGKRDFIPLKLNQALV